MNNTIEALEEIKKYYAQDIIRGTETGSKRFKAIEKAISNEKVLEIAGDMLPSYESGGRADEDIPDDKEHAYSLGYGDGQIDYKHKAEPVLAKQILKVEELEAEAKLGNIPYKEAIALKAENKKLKEQQLTEDEIKKIFGYSAIGFIHDMDCPCKADPDDGDSYDECKCEALNNFAKKIIEAREEKNG